MDFNKAIEFATSSSTYINLNTITAAPTVGTPFSGYVVESVSYANAGISGFTGSLAQRDGLEADIALIGPRQVQMIVQVYGSTEADFYDKLNLLNGALSPYPAFSTSDDGFRNMRFSQSTISNSGYSSTGFIPMRMKLRPQALPAYTLANDLVTARTSDRGVSTKASITFLAKDPRKLTQTALSGSIGVSASTTSTTLLTNNGNYTAYPTFVVTSSHTASQTLTISGSTGTSSIWTSVFTVPAATTVTIDSSDRFVKTGTSTLALNMGLISGSTTSFPYLPSGATTITVSAMTSTTITYSFNEAWL
jgi:hypothetical protein